MAVGAEATGGVCAESADGVAVEETAAEVWVAAAGDIGADGSTDEGVEAGLWAGAGTVGIGEVGIGEVGIGVVAGAGPVGTGVMVWVAAAGEVGISDGAAGAGGGVISVPEGGVADADKGSG